MSLALKNILPRSATNKSIAFGICFTILTIVLAMKSSAQETYATQELLDSRKAKQWRIPIAESGPTRIPRVCASLRAAYFEGMEDKPVVVHPEIEYWEIRFKGKPLASHVILRFDAFPSLPKEVGPTKQAGDGTLTLRCSHGQVTGEKLRFEPQSHKNTIGYWAVAEDTVSWPIQITKPGTFNVGMLQGASEKGGGTARFSLLQDDNVISSLECKVESTGHFQNFKWSHVGELNVEKAGQYSLKIEAVKIDNVALMDVRQVHLSPQPKH